MAMNAADRYNGWSLAGTIAGWVSLLLGERVVVGGNVQGLAKGFTVLAVILLVGSFAHRVWAAATATGDRRGANRAFAALSGTGLLALLLYGAASTWGRSLLKLSRPPGSELDTFGGVVTVTWIVLLLISLLPTVLGELARFSMAHAEKLESRRVIAAIVAGLSVALAVAYGSLFTYGAGKVQTWTADFSFFRVSAPSDSTLRMVQNLEEPLKVRVYYPGYDEAGKRVEKYLNEANAHAGRLEIAVHDRLVEPDLAKKDEVTEDGVVVLSLGPKTEQFQVGLYRGVRPPDKLRTLDGEFQTALLKVTRAKRKAYFTSAHGELSGDLDAQNPRSAGMLHQFVRSQNYEIEAIGLRHGLAREVPKDASMVLVLGPTDAFTESEVESLKRYAENGGSLFLALDPQGKADLQPLAAIAGLTWTRGPVLHKSDYYPINRNPSDKQNIIASSFTSHPSVSTLSNITAGGAAVLLLGSAALDKAPDADKRFDIDFAVQTQAGAWVEKNDTWELDDPSEKEGSAYVGAAVTVSSQEGGEAPADGSKQMRVFVLGDVDCISDFVVTRTRVNALLFADGFRWLARDESLTGTSSDEEDVAIVHSNQSDQLWFYGAIVGMPFLILGGGLALTRRRKKPKKPGPPPAGGTDQERRQP